LRIVAAGELEIPDTLVELAESVLGIDLGDVL